jgi:hypothetical protein
MEVQICDTTERQKPTATETATGASGTPFTMEHAGRKYLEMLSLS